MAVDANGVSGGNIPESSSDELSKLEEQIALATKNKELVDAQRALALAQQSGSDEIDELQAKLDVIIKNNEILDSELLELQKRKAILAESLPTGTTQPRTGEVTVGDEKRYLTEIVANHGLSKIGDNIVESIKGKISSDDGVLIVDDIEFAINDFYYRDIENKINTFISELDKISPKCVTQKTIFPRKVSISKDEQKDFEELLMDYQGYIAKENAINSIAKPTAVLSTLAIAAPMIAGAVSGSLSAIGDIISYFRSDYTIKGQTLQDVESMYVDTIIAGKLAKENKSVYLMNFNLITQSTLLDKINSLIAKHLALLTCIEEVKSSKIEPYAALITELNTHLSLLKPKLVEALIKIDDTAIIDLKTEIADVENKLSNFRQNRVPDSEVTALEAHIAALRTQLITTLAADTGKAHDALKDEIDNVTKQLEDPKLSAAKKKELETNQKNLLSELTKAFVSVNSNIINEVNTQIGSAEKKLATIRKDRVPDSEVTALETHLAALRTALVTFESVNDNDAKDSLEKEISRVESEIEQHQVHMKDANEIVSSGAKIIEAIDTFISNVTTVPSGDKYPPLFVACAREYIHKNSKIKFLLKISHMSSGADYIIEKPPFWKKKVTVSYLGGGVVSYILADTDGKVVASGTEKSIAALDHNLGESPKLLQWSIRDES